MYIFVGIDDLFAVQSELLEVGVAVRWRSIGLALGLKDPQLKEIASNCGTDSENCLSDMLRVWLNREYDSGGCGVPTWQRLSEAVGHRAGGRNPAAAEQILQTCVSA